MAHALPTIRERRSENLFFANEGVGSNITIMWTNKSKQPIKTYMFVYSHFSFWLIILPISISIIAVKVWLSLLIV